jgi:hypothetical protein
MDVSTLSSPPSTLTSQLVESDIAKRRLMKEREDSGYEGLFAEMIEK